MSSFCSLLIKRRVWDTHINFSRSPLDQTCPKGDSKNGIKALQQCERTLGEVPLAERSRRRGSGGGRARSRPRTARRNARNPRPQLLFFRRDFMNFVVIAVNSRWLPEVGVFWTIFRLCLFTYCELFYVYVFFTDFLRYYWVISWIQYTTLVFIYYFAHIQICSQYRITS